MNSAPNKPTGNFAQTLESVPTALQAAGGATAQSYAVELLANGASIGWLGENDGQWCVAVSRESAVQIEPYIWQGVTYYRNAKDTSRYLSVSDGYHYVGFYNWVGARGWTFNNGVLTSQYTNASLSFWNSDNGYIYANAGNGYTPLQVRFVD